MMQKTGVILKLLLVGVALLWMAGCSTTGGAGKEGGVSVEDRGAAGAGAGGAMSEGAGAGGAFSGDPLDNPNSPLANRVFYFDYDSSIVRDSDRETLAAHAEYMAGHPSASVRLEGHTDERGSREYNIALGERRANAVRQLLLFNGVNANQVQTVSYGEERPAALGHDEDSWSLNRRVEMIYTSR